jgi:hypothetical protein
MHRALMSARWPRTFPSNMKTLVSETSLASLLCAVVFARLIKSASEELPERPLQHIQHLSRVRCVNGSHIIKSKSLS